MISLENDCERDARRWRQTRPETIFDALDDALKAGADRAFLEFDDGTLTFSDLDVHSTKFAHSLALLGVRQGQTVVTVMESSTDAVVVWFAINKLGAIWVPLNTAYRGEFLRHQISDSQARLLICDGDFLNSIVAVSDGTPELELILCRGDVELAKSPRVKIEPYEAHRGSNTTPMPIRVKPDDISCLVYTSGTTGRSKGCMLSYNYVCNQGRQQNISVPPLPREMTWTSLPLFHSSANSYVVVATLIAQTRARLTRRFSVREFWYEIERSGASSAMLMATMFPLLAHAPDNDAMLRCRGQLQVVTGVPVTNQVRKIWHDRFGVGHVNSFGYGQTEASKISLLPWGDPPPPLTSAGSPSEDFEVKVVGPDGIALSADKPGEVLVRPRRPNVMYAGYWNHAEETVKVWRDLWMHTGDIGKFDQDGHLYFVDRKKDYVRSRGENIASVEVENAFMVHPDISEVAFHAVASPANGEDDLKITVVPREGAVLSEEKLCHWAIEWLPYFSVPRYIEFRSELPKTPTGRVQKHELRNDGVTPSTWDREGAGIKVRRGPARSHRANA